ncbi:hypothetical protein SRABI130_05668 [Pseudomonas sp. Bi130]|nr:hypothetical protein SRABI130_05668 [Pseudomonas sp. Bi130]
MIGMLDSTLTYLHEQRIEARTHQLMSRASNR